ASPTGNGLKAVFCVPADAARHAASFAAVAAHVRNLCAVEIDHACRDVARLCFVSYDPDAFLNRDAAELAPLVEPTESAPKPVVLASVTRAAAAAKPDLRRRVATELFGDIQWIDETRGFCACPGREKHTNPDGPLHCRVHLDGAPTIHCFHNSCRAAVDAANHELRSRIGIVESATGPEAAEVARLATLPPLDYDRERQTSAEAGKRRTNAGGTQGGVVEFPAVAPWPEPVDGAAVLDATAAVFAHYVALPPHGADTLALWTAHAHAYESFLHTPRLNLRSPEKGCGKTTLLDVLAALVPRPLRTESITPAVLFRLVQAHKPVLLLDEVDTYLRESEELRGLLNAGHKRGAKAYRCEGDRNEVRAFAAFAPAVLAGIGELPGTLHDRSLPVKLIRAKPGEVPARFDSRRTASETEVCRRLARWTADAAPQLETLDPSLPETAFNRLADNWRPLFAIAQTAGGDWPARAVAAFISLTNDDDLDAHGLGTTLLADIRDVLAASRGDRIASVRLAEALAEIEGRPWAEFGKSRRPISANHLARLLRPFGISSHTVRLGDDTAKGYQLDDFQEAFTRYLPAPPLSKRNTVTSPVNIGDSLLFETSQPESVCRFESAVPANEIKGCDGVTDAEPPAEVLHV
ncbi:MAG: DUF3631 domain-containing protein, partial [Acidimicrobiia bacterium]|nr:DUF3631 domain-containing protein [Acidimicrobiia bacterium]